MTETLVRFDASVQEIGDRPIVRLPADASALLPSRGQVAVTGLINGQPFDTVLEPDGMRGHWLEVGDSVGDTLTIELTPTKAWPEVTVPQDLQDALDAEPELTEYWADLTPMAR